MTLHWLEHDSICVKRKNKCYLASVSYTQLINERLRIESIASRLICIYPRARIGPVATATLRNDPIDSTHQYRLFAPGIRESLSIRKNEIQLITSRRD